MKVAAIMPTYNQPQFIDEAVRSVVGQVDKLIIVDDGSTQNSGLDRFLEFPNVTIRRHLLNSGTAVAINTGFEEVDREYYDWVTWVSSDNTYTPDWMQHFRRIVAEWPGRFGALYSDFWYELPSRPSRILSEPHHRDKLINQEACYYGPSFIIRKEVWQDHRGKINHDYDNWLRVEEACWAADLEIRRIPLPLCHYRAHPQRVTITRKHEYDAPHWQTVGHRRRKAHEQGKEEGS